MQRLLATAAAILTTSIASTTAAHAQGFHDVDFALRMDSGVIEVGATVDGAVVWGRNLLASEFGREGVPNLTNDPGADTGSGSVVPGTRININIDRAVRLWDPIAMDFTQVAPETISVEKSRQVITSPDDDTPTAAIRLGTADASGRFHHHPTFALNAPSMLQGVWLLTVELTDVDEVLEPSGPLFIVFRQGEPQISDQADAIAWVEANLLDTPAVCAADLAAPVGTLDFFDVLEYLSLFDAQDPAADLAAPAGTFDFFDVLEYLGQFDQGC